MGDWASTAVDLTVILALCLVSGGATAALLPVFFLLPISVAFQDRPALTAIIGTITALGYLAVWIFYSERDDKLRDGRAQPGRGFLQCRVDHVERGAGVSFPCFIQARNSLRP